MDSKQNLPQAINTPAGAKSLTKPLERMFLDHCYRHAGNFSHNNSNVVAAYEEIKQLIEAAFIFGISEQSKS